MLVMCQVLRVTRSGYYAWQKRPQSKRSRENERLLIRIRAAYKMGRQSYGSPRVHKVLRAQGERCGRKRVEKLMAQNGIRARQKKRFVLTTDSRHDHPAAANVLDRHFVVDEPDKVWVSDITYIPTGEGWLYLSGVLDLCTKTVVGWSMGEKMESRLVMDALEMAYQRRRPGRGLLHHSDRGSQYASEDYRKLLSAYGMRESMSRKGNCWDNAPMESFFGTLKRELVHHRRYRTRQEARKDIFEYIEVFYNRQRLHSSLGYMSPSDFEKQWLLWHQAA